MNQRELDLLSDRLEDVLGAHRCLCRVVGATVTPRIVTFEIVTAPGVALGSIRSVADDIARSLATPSVRIGQVGHFVTVELAREDTRPVQLVSLLDKLAARPPVTAVLGTMSDGTPLLVRLPSPAVAHVLVAGTTGSGKTVLLRSIILSLALRHLSGDLGLLLVDPRGGAAFGCFDGLLQLVGPVVRDAGEAAAIMPRLVAEMERRDRSKDRLLPMVVVIDELADMLMADRSGELEAGLTRLAAHGRNAGIHLIAATQRPSADVLGGVMRANFPIRIVGRWPAPRMRGWRPAGGEPAPKPCRGGATLCSWPVMA